MLFKNKFYIIISLLICMFLTGCSNEEIKTVNIKAVGDNLIHSPIYNYGEKHNSDYSFIFENIKSEIQKADLAIINQETIFTTNPQNYSGKEIFASPINIGDAIIEAGFDVVTSANNHSFDIGPTGIFETLSFYEKHINKILCIGLNKNEKEYNEITTIEKNGITFALLNYTYDTNISLNKNNYYFVDSFKDYEKVANDIEKAEKIADVTIVFPHWGTEFTTKTNKFQEQWTKIFLELGVDIVIGTHPHVIQPYKLLKDNKGHQMLVYYSLGNFISCQNEKERILGGMADITIQKKRNKIEFLSYNMIPLVTHQSNGFYTTYLLENYTEELAQKHMLNITKKEIENMFLNNKE